MFEIGFKPTYLSKQFDNTFSNKKIYLVPHNRITKEIYIELLKLKPLDVKFVDSNKKGKEIISFEEMKECDFILMYSPNYYKEISSILPKEKLYFLYRKSKEGFKYKKFTYFNYFYVNFFEKVNDKILNLYYGTRLYIANKFNVCLHKNELTLKNFKNCHLNRRAFIIGNGPSLKVNDLSKLENEITFASNKIFLAYNETRWRPTYYSVEDSYDMHEYYDKVKEMTMFSKVILPFKHIKNHKVINDAIYYKLNFNEENRIGCSNDLLSGLYSGSSVTYTMLQMAICMGIKEIYLIGVDFSYTLPKSSEDDVTIVNEAESNHFHKDYRARDDKWFRPDLEYQKQAFIAAKKYCSENSIKIYNATRGGKLDVFERVNFDEIV